jgi:hypothetical protein
MDQTDREWRARRLEYEKLREEIQESIRNQVRVLGYGGTALSILLGVGLLEESIVFLVVLPVLAFFFFVLWNVEQTRMMRAGDYLSFVEDEVNQSLANGEPAMLWEGWLRWRADHDGRDIYDFHYYAQMLVLGLFLLVILSGIGVVQYLQAPAFVRLGIAALYIGFLAVGLVLVRGTIRHDRSSMEHSYGILRMNLREEYDDPPE